MMDRKTFLRRGFLSAAAVTAAGMVAKAFGKHDEELIEHRKKNFDNQVGFNHLPNPKSLTMNNNMVLHKADTRGHANHGWLDARHSFSFANYYNPERMNFGVLRVLNDDKIDGGRGFGMHPHDNMEIITIPLSGDLEHRDSMGNVGVIRQGDVQVMSAGTGVQHSEKNKNLHQEVRLLQIWVFPQTRDIKPRYDQKTFNIAERTNQWQNLVSPTPEKDGGMWINQNAWFFLGNFETGKTTNYTVRSEKNGVYVFLISGKSTVNGQPIEQRDAVGVWNTKELNIEVGEQSEILIMEVPMNLG